MLGWRTQAGTEPVTEAGTKPPGQQGFPQLPRGSQRVREIPQGFLGSVVASDVILKPLSTHAHTDEPAV